MLVFLYFLYFILCNLALSSKKLTRSMTGRNRNGERGKINTIFVGPSFCGTVLCIILVYLVWANPYMQRGCSLTLTKPLLVPRLFLLL